MPQSRYVTPLCMSVSPSVMIWAKHGDARATAIAIKGSLPSKGNRRLR